MKTLLFSFITILSIVFTNSALADKVVIEQTTDWTGVPIVVDVDKHTFVAPNYYYSYTGHRCFVTKQSFVGIDAIIFRGGIDGATEIYCYPED
jgi:carbonic anhydrase/acetyltransferase-like protein (isoleucine patch superfamily)